MSLKFIAALSCVFFALPVFISCGNGNQNTETEKQSNDSIKYEASKASTGWVALYDTRMAKRCYMTRDDYYALKSGGCLRAEYEYLRPLGIVVKYSGIEIIWGFDGLKNVSWSDAQSYVKKYSPDGHKWRMLTRFEASAINTNHFDFSDIFQSYYPQDISYLDSFLYIENWTSSLSDEVYIKDGNEYNLVYTLDIYNKKSRLEKGWTTYDGDVHNVYPISDL